jgi:hypothetical protein
MILSESQNRRGTLVLLVCYLVLACFHMILGLQMKGPSVAGDEMGYLGNGRFLAGKGVMPNMTGTHAGYSLLISPAFFLSNDPTRVYLIVLTINSFLISSLFLILYYWLKNLFPFDHRSSLLASLITSLYPPFLLHSNVAWAENAIIPLFLVPSILLYLTIKRKSLSLGILFGFSVSFLYTIHPRSLPLLPIAALYLLSAAFLKVLPSGIVAASLSSLTVGLVATLRLHGYLRLLGWEGGGISSVHPILSNVLSWNGMGKFLVGVAGQLWYLTASTYGLLMAGCLLFGFTIWRNISALQKKTPASAEVHALLFYGLSSAGILTLSVLFLSSFKWNVERLIYGRYNECFVAAFVASALGAILSGGYDEKWRKTVTVIVTVGLCGLGLVTSLIEVKPIKVFSMIPVNVHGLFPILGTFIYKVKFSFFSAIVACTLIFLSGMIFLSWTFRWRRVLGVIALIGLFLMMGLSQYVVLCLPGAKKVDSLVLPKIIRSMPDVKTVSFDQAYGRPAEFYQYQYFLPHTRFLFFDSSKNILPKSEIFITSPLCEVPPKIGARLVALEKEGDLALWVKREAMQNRWMEEKQFLP